MLEKIYSNMSVCHLKQSNWKRAIETADKVNIVFLLRSTTTSQKRHLKALAQNGNNFKALFRKAKALGELGHFEKAEKILEELLEKNEAGELLCHFQISHHVVPLNLCNCRCTCY